MKEEKQEYIIIDWGRPHGHERVPTDKKILLTKDEAYDLNKLLRDNDMIIDFIATPNINFSSNFTYDVFLLVKELN